LALALASKVQALALALALRVEALALALALRFWPWLHHWVCCYSNSQEWLEYVLALASAKRSLNAKVDLPFHNHYTYFCIYAFQSSPKLIGMETYDFQPFPVIHGQNPYSDPLCPLYVIVVTRINWLIIND